jgi:iron(III) transport system substrate-binding protein
MSSPVFTELIAQAVKPQRAWVTSRLSIFTAAYNTTLIAPADAPQSYDALLDPKWQGKLGIEADDGNWFMSVAGALGEDKAVALFRNIVAANGMSIRKGHTLLSNLVVAGEVPLALTVYGYRINELKGKGAPIEGVVLPPAVALPTGIAVFANAPHPYAAALFMDFFLSGGQRILLARGNVPSNRTVAEPPPGLTFVDVAKFLDQGDKWTKLFREIFAGQGR